jgi:16S rRNA C967 or C1407 C5-methylase (RsmB/RsmF family)/NOL1/NOP2/fmu family ribosome biogenesis protein
VQLPAAFLHSLESLEGFNREAFLKVHESPGEICSVRFNPFKLPFRDAEQQTVPSSHLPLQNNIPWAAYGYYLSSRPSFTMDPLFHAGCYYVQEASSMFLEEVLRQTTGFLKPLRVLDLCAAPGGKSTHLLSLLSNDSLLVSNEVIRSRAGLLKENIIKWGSANVVVTQNDPRDFQQLENYFDIIVVDAPCSGSGLFRRDPGAVQEWSLNNVSLCSRRQQRILADVLPALKNGGVLIYSTCSYSREEDEDISTWLVQEMQLVNCPLEIPVAWGITASGGGYRFWPNQVKGEGFFIAAFRKPDGYHAPNESSRWKEEKFSKQESDLISHYVKTEGVRFKRQRQSILAFPENLAEEMQRLVTTMRAVAAGITIGEIIREKLLPDHALAMSAMVSDNVNRIALNRQQAIQYLKKKELNIEDAPKGWNLVTYDHFPLGWINVLTGRINNYYPGAWRILKD